MYVCGMTIYDLCHIGHARMMMAFDVVQRWLKCSGYRVTYVRNITDIDDKIIKRALERSITIRALTDEMIAAMHADIALLGIEPPTQEPRATDYVPQMLCLIKRLEAKGLAYQASNGDVNYAVRKFAGYGKLSGKSLDELRAGERVAVQEGKEDPLDFVLWKAAKATEPEDAKWASAYGPGRPGWHIECSAMSCATLGETFDIHGGGADLQFPHHENEIAQSEGATGKPLANFWVHNGFVRVDNEKMSKSLGNFFTIRDVGNLGLELITGGGLHFPDGERTQAAAFASVGVLYNLFRAPSVNLAVGLRGLVGWARLTCPTTDDDQKTCANGRFGIAFEAPLRVEYFFAPSFSVAGAVGPVVGLNEPDGNPLTGERNSRSVSLTRGEFSGGLGFSYYFF
jgi:hypothetical protein